MRYTRYLYGAVGFLCVCVVFVVLVHAVTQPSKEGLSGTTQSSTTTALAASTTAQQKTDLSLAQYPEGPSAAVTGIASKNNPVPKASALTPGCSLHFSFAPTANVVAPGGTIQYAALLSNKGNQTCVNVSFSIYYADNETFVSATRHPTANDYFWSAGNLESGQTFSVTLSTKENSQSSEGQVDNEACATADNSPDVCPQNVIFVQTGAAPALAALTSPANNPVTQTTLPGGPLWGSAFGQKEFGAWVWETPVQMTLTYESDEINAAAKNGFNVLYVTIDDYLAIAALPPGSVRSAQQAAYFQELAQFVTLAHAKNIAVDIEGGDTTWGEPANLWKGYALIDFLQAYNLAYPSEQVRGLQYDVEPYLSAEYQTDPGTVLQDFVTFVSESAARMARENPNARFSVVIPHFYDDQIQWTPPIDYNGTSEYTLTALLQALQQVKQSDLLILAYRNSLGGANGSEALAQTAVQETAAGGYSTKVIVAQETGDVQPPYVTFYGLSKQSLYNALTGIETTFGGQSSFGGVAVEYLDTFLALK